MTRWKKREQFYSFPIHLLSNKKNNWKLLTCAYIYKSGDYRITFEKKITYLLYIMQAFSPALETIVYQLLPRKFYIIGDMGKGNGIPGIERGGRGVHENKGNDKGRGGGQTSSSGILEA